MTIKIRFVEAFLTTKGEVGLQYRIGKEVYSVYKDEQGRIVTDDTLPQPLRLKLVEGWYRDSKRFKKR